MRTAMVIVVDLTVTDEDMDDKGHGWMCFVDTSKRILNRKFDELTRARSGDGSFELDFLHIARVREDEEETPTVVRRVLRSEKGGPGSDAEEHVREALDVVGVNADRVARYNGPSTKIVARVKMNNVDDIIWDRLIAAIRDELRMSFDTEVAGQAQFHLYEDRVPEVEHTWSLVG